MTLWDILNLGIILIALIVTAIVTVVIAIIWSVNETKRKAFEVVLDWWKVAILGLILYSLWMLTALIGAYGEGAQSIALSISEWESAIPLY